MARREIAPESPVAWVQFQIRIVMDWLWPDSRRERAALRTARLKNDLQGRCAQLVRRRQLIERLQAELATGEEQLRTLTQANRAETAGNGAPALDDIREDLLVIRARLHRHEQAYERSVAHVTNLRRRLALFSQFDAQSLTGHHA